MSTLADIQEQLLEQDKVLSIDAEILLPRIGGYNARPYSSELEIVELPRPSEIKALWRWWMRVILSGVYGGRKKYYELDREVSEVLGSTEKQSVFSVVINAYSDILRKIIERVESYKNLILKVIPEALSEFANQWNSDKNLRNMADFEIKLSLPLQLSIRPRLRIRGFNNLGRLFRGKFGIKLRPIERRGQIQGAKASIGKREFQELMKRLNIAKEKHEELVTMYERLVKIADIPRIKILMQRRKKEREDDKFVGKLNEDNMKYLKRMAEDITPLAVLADLGEKIPLKISVTANRATYEQVLRFSIASLLLSLLLGATGSIAGRGFGSIVIKRINVNKKYESLLKEDAEKVNKILECENESSLKNELNEYIEHVIGLARELNNGENIDSRLPEVPSLIPNSHYFKLEVVECKNLDIIRLLKIIGDTTLKAKWKEEVGLPPKEPGGNLHTWILGLPRSAEDTGYFVRVSDELNKVKDDVGRRPSAIRLKIFENAKGKRFIIIYGFLSRDWPVERLVHKGQHYRRGKNVIKLGLMSINVYQESTMNREEFLKAVFDSAFKFVYSIARRYCSIASSGGAGSL